MATELESILISCGKTGQVTFMEAHPETFGEAIELALSDDQPFSWRAASLVSDCMKKNDPRVKKRIKNIIDCLEEKGDGHQRELLKILMQMELDKKHEGYLFNMCMNIWEAIGKQPSVRITALRMIYKIAKKHPELSSEIDFLTQDHYLETLSPGVKNSVSRMIKELSAAL